MNRDRQEYFRPLIETRITELETQIKQRTEDATAIEPDKSIGRLSRLDSMQMQQISRNAQRRQQSELYRLKEALVRIDRGHYGKCQLCGRDIGEPRLEIQPDAAFCIGCAGG